jgi:hypothetical protein
MRNSTSPGSVMRYANVTGFRRAGFGYALSEPWTSGPAVGGGPVGVSWMRSAELRCGSPPTIGQLVVTSAESRVGSE